MKKTIILLLLIFSSFIQMQAQPGFSVGTDLSVLRNNTKDQRFTTIGQSIQLNFHVSKKEIVYAWLSYYVTGKYTNLLLATVKDSMSSAEDMGYYSLSKLGYRHFSVGWKHYFKGSFDNEESWNAYGSAGFGMLTSRIANTFDRTIDTAVYALPQKAISGEQKFRRLTFDLAIGAETKLAIGVFLYGEIKTWLQASDYPSAYLYNNNMPKVILLNAGVRILFD